MITWDQAEQLKPTQKVYYVNRVDWPAFVVGWVFVVSAGENGVFLQATNGSLVFESKDWAANRDGLFDFHLTVEAAEAAGKARRES